MKKLLFIYRTPRRKVYEDWKKGKGPDSLLFGANHLTRMGYKVDFFDSAYSPFNIFHPLFYPLEHLLIKETGMGFKLDQACFLSLRFNNYDVIVATGDSAGLPILFLKYLGIIKKPVIFMSAGLAGALKGKTDTWLGKFYKKILTKADIFTSYSQVEIDFFQKEMGIRGIKYIPLATDWNYFSRPSNKKRDIICAVGTEQGRDYKTFFEAVKGLAIKAEIACHPNNIRGLSVPDNVKVHFNIPVTKVLKIYQQSLISVVPCYERYRSSGQMVVLESAAAGLATVASRIKGIITAFDFQDKNNLLYVEPLNSTILRDKIQFLLRKKDYSRELGEKASIKVKNKYSTQQMAKTLSDFIKYL